LILRKQGQALGFLQSHAINVSTAFVKMADRYLICLIMKKLPEEQAKMIFAAYYEEKSHREISEESGLPLGTVKSRIRLALSRLRANLDEIER